MNLTIHRGCHEIGGSCVELRNSSYSLFIDFGMPLTEKNGVQYDIKSRANQTGPELVKARDLPDISGIYKWQNRSTYIKGLLLSHYHSDHCGFAKYLHPEIPVYAGEPTHRLLELNSLFTGIELFPGPKKNIKHKNPLALGSFRITPYTVDHSAFDAYAFLVETDNKCLLYSGDLRSHGRKHNALPELFNALSGKTIDALILEGTMLSSIETEVKTEKDLEEDTVTLLNSSNSIALAYVSSHNIDRLVTFYRAAKRCKRLFVVDIYTANVLELFHNYANIPYPSKNFDNLKVFYPFNITSRLTESHNRNLAYKFNKFKITRKEITDNQQNIIMTIRPSMMYDLRRINITNGGNFIYSIWKGSQLEKDNAMLINYARQNKMNINYIHTSGHASVKTLKDLVFELNPKLIIPIHTMTPEGYSIFNAIIKTLQDGKSLNL